MAEAIDSSTMPVPCYLVHEILQDGTCPVHLRSHLASLLTGTQASTPSGDSFFDGLDGQCALAITAFLPLEDLLTMRTSSSELLQNTMRLPLQADHSHRCSSSDADTQAAGFSQTTEEDAVVCAHDRIRVRLWLQRLGDLTAGGADETVFDSAVRGFVDKAMRRRLEGEVVAAKHGMAEEVRAAKANMLQCVQAISEEVDRRVHEKVAALQDEFDRRVSEQDVALREMVEKRVTMQTEMMKAEVDRRTDSVRQALESQAKLHEDVAAKLQTEVASIRKALMEQVYEQEARVSCLTEELDNLKSQFAEVCAVREALEGKVCKHDEAVIQLSKQLSTFKAEYDRASRDHTPVSSDDSCWAWLKVRR
jgi:hypothetical protein